MELTNISTEDLKLELERRGYATQSIWQNADVDIKLEEINQSRIEDGLPIVELIDDEKNSIMVDAMGNDFVMGAIWDTIEYCIDEYIEENNL